MNLFVRKLLISKSLYTILIIITIIFFLYKTVIIKHESKYDINDKTVEGIITDYKLDGNVLSLIIQAKEKVKINYYINSEKEKDYYREIIKYGIKIIVNGELSMPINNTIPNTFNYKKYLSNQQIYFLLLASNIKISNSNTSIFYQLKNVVRRQIMEHETNDYLLTFILGDKTLLDDDVFENYRIIGITHLFAISGMHINFFAVLIMFILKRIKIKENKRYCVVIIFLLFYAFLTNYTASVLRSVLFYSLICLNKIFYTEISNIKLFILTIVILTIINPFVIYNIGFIYSFITCFGLIISKNYINSKNYVVNLIRVSWVSFLFSLPITLLSFYEINILSILNNLFYVPFVTVILYPVSLIVCILSFLEPVLSLLINISEFIANVLANNSLNIIIPKCNIIIYFIYYFLIINYVTSSRRYIYLAVILIFIPKLFVLFNNNYEMYFLDVGQGDAILIRSPNNKENIMIDVGGKIKYDQESWQIKNKSYHIADNLLIFLKSLGISRLNAIITTHGDDDHIGELPYILSKYKVDKIVLNKGEYNKLEKQVIKSDVEIIDKYYSKYYQIDYLETNLASDENDNSNIMLININNHKILFLGDAYQTQEIEIINKYKLENITIVKVGHHGSKTSSNETFFKLINPIISIISSGRNNPFNHPSKETIDMFNRNKYKYFNTQTSGTIFFTINSIIRYQIYCP